MHAAEGRVQGGHIQEELIRRLKDERKDDMKRITILTGAFGSGKTECAVSLARAAGRRGDDVALIDMDIVNAFFRSTFQEEKLTADNVELIATGTAKIGADMPVVTPEIMSVFTGSDRRVVIDLGGDETGARALGQFKNNFEKLGEDLDVLCVVNTCRPMTDTPEKIIQMIEKMQGSSRLKVTGLVNNSNLSVKTTPEVLLEGDEIVGEVSRRTGLPVVYHAIHQDVDIPGEVREKLAGALIEVEGFNLPEWAKDSLV